MQVLAGLEILIPFLLEGFHALYADRSIFLCVNEFTASASICWLLLPAYIPSNLATSEHGNLSRMISQPVNINMQLIE